MAYSNDSKVRTMLAKYNGVCRYCGGAIVAGVSVISTRHGAWGHDNCAEAPGGAPSASQPVSKHQAAVSGGGLLAAVSEAKAASVQDAHSTLVNPEQFSKPFAPSQRQTAIFEAIAYRNRHLVIEAYAGTGKTTTLKHAIPWVAVNTAIRAGRLALAPDGAAPANVDPSDWAGLIEENGIAVGLCAFNKHIADTLKAVMPRWCWTGTVHGMGYGFLLKHFDGRVKVDGYKVEGLMDSRLPSGAFVYPELALTRNLPNKDKALRRMLRGALRKVVSLAKSTLVDYNDPGALLAMIENYGIEIEADDTGEYLALVVGLTPRIMEQCLSQTEVIDFDDMIWMNLALGLANPTYDYLFGDEVQDWNLAQRKLVLSALKPNGRIIAVGDRYQSLYGFRGADVDSIPNLISELNAEVLPLDITYRCPERHVQLAQQIVPGIQARPGAPEGTVADMEAKKLQGTLAYGDMVLCRVNAPLVPLALRLIRKGLKASVRGRDIGKGLSDLVQRFQSHSIEGLAVSLDEYYQREYQRLEAKERWEQIQALDDKVQTLQALISECDSVAGLLGRLDTIFSDKVDGIVLSSVHRAKGLEAERVFILRPDLMPHPMAKGDWQQQQEQNVKYVAVTRSLRELYFVVGEEE